MSQCIPFLRSIGSPSALNNRPSGAITKLHFVTIIFVLTLSCCLSVTGQFTTIPLPGCPPGYDCVGAQLSPYLGANASINCMTPTNRIKFQGYTCAGVEVAGSTDAYLAECHSGYYCPTPNESLICPSGSWCARGTTVPVECRAGEICPEGTYKPRFLTPLIILVILACAVPILYFVMHHRIAKRNALRSQNLSSQPKKVAIQVKGLKGSGESHLQPKLNLQFDRVCVTVKGHDNAAAPPSIGDESQPLSTSLPNSNGVKTILHDITGTIRGGRLTAVMGPSGSGKTTFLNSLLAKVPISSGSISVNHTHTVKEVIKMNVVGYVPQQDTMLTMLTVRDLIEHSAFMRLPNSMSKAAKLARVEAVMALLGISEIADSVVGDDLNRGISGGQIKRCNIAMELVADPLILFLDEPTSGLDSAAAQQVCDGLHAIAQQQKLVCCVIHQPRWEIFSRFDDVLLLATGGYPIYFGPVKGIRDFFASMGRVPPPNCNPADYYLDVIQEQGFVQEWLLLGGIDGMRRKAMEDGKIPPTNVVRLHLPPLAYESSFGGSLSVNHPSSSLPAMSTGHGIDSAIDVDVATVNVAPVSRSMANNGEDEEKDVQSTSTKPTYHKQPQHESVSAPLNKLGNYTSHTPITPNQPASFWSQVWYLTYRNLLIDCRNARLCLLDTVLQLIPPLGLGINALSDDLHYPPLPAPVASTCIQMIGERCEDELLQMGSFASPPFFYVMIIPVGAVVWSVNTFGRHMNVFFRDRIAGVNVTAYFLSKILYDFIHLARMTFIFISIFFLLTGPAGGYGYWLATITGTFWAAMGVSYFISIIVPFNRATTIAVVTVVSFAVTSGLLPPLTVVEDWNILRAIWYLSYPRWAGESFLVLANNDQPTDGRMANAIRAAGFNAGNVSIDIALTFCIGIMWRVIAYLALRRAKPRTEF